MSELISPFGATLRIAPGLLRVSPPSAISRLPLLSSARLIGLVNLASVASPPSPLPTGGDPPPA